MPKQIDAILKNDASIKAYAPRFETYALLSGDEKSVGSMIVGIVPSKEKALSKLSLSLSKGAYLSDSDTNAIYIGSELARTLKSRYRQPDSHGRFFHRLLRCC